MRTKHYDYDNEQRKLCLTAAMLCAHSPPLTPHRSSAVRVLLDKLRSPPLRWLLLTLLLLLFICSGFFCDGSNVSSEYGTIIVYDDDTRIMSEENGVTLCRVDGDGGDE